MQYNVRWHDVSPTTPLPIPPNQHVPLEQPIQILGAVIHTPHTPRDTARMPMPMPMPVPIALSSRLAVWVAQERRRRGLHRRRRYGRDVTTIQCRARHARDITRTRCPASRLHGAGTRKPRFTRLRCAGTRSGKG